ncbi:hypothetical protein RRSWK_00024 [Rhodopirellula sp. SWK7]|nr:hypothetical protein RRSWK_00024 [Rhodopirellula sp. SWK7]
MIHSRDVVRHQPTKQASKSTAAVDAAEICTNVTNWSMSLLYHCLRKRNVCMEYRIGD